MIDQKLANNKFETYKNIETDNEIDTDNLAYTFNDLHDASNVR